MILSAKSASFLAVVLQQSALVLVIRYSKTRHQDAYLSSVAVWSAECIKILLSTTLEHNTADVRTKGSWPWLSLLKDMLSTIPTSESFKLIVPAFLYVVQNNLLFFALSNLSTPTYQVSNQGKLITTAIISRILLKKKISYMQYMSLVLLAGGVALVNLSETRLSSHDQKDHILGLLAVMVSCVTSGFCGVYFELVLKSTTQISVHRRNFQLAFWSFLLAAGTIVCNDMPKVMERGVFQGFDGTVLIVIICQALTGLVVSFMLKYADAILKGFATSIAVIVSTMASMILFDTKVSILFFFGFAMVVSAMKIYLDFPQKSDDSNSSKSTVAYLPVSTSETTGTEIKTSLLKTVTGAKNIKITFFALLLTGGLLSIYEFPEMYQGSRQKKTSRALFFTSVKNETFMVPNDVQYIANWRGAFHGNHHYLREQEDIAARGKGGNCARTLDTLAWLMDEVNAKKSALMLAYGGLINIHREKDFVDSSTGRYINDHIDLWASLETIVHVGQLEEELFSRFGWSVRASVNENSGVVLMQLFASCGHIESTGEVTSGEPAIVVHPLAVVPGNGTRIIRDLWQGNDFLESMLYPAEHVKFNSNGASYPLKLQLPSKVFDIMACLYGDWMIPSDKHASDIKNDCLNYYEKP